MLAFFVKYGIISVVFSTSWNSSGGRALHCNEGVVSSSLISSLYMTDGSPVSWNMKMPGFLVCMDVVEGRQRKVASLREWRQSGMFLRFCEKDVGEGRQRKVTLLRGGCKRGCFEF